MKLKVAIASFAVAAVVVTAFAFTTKRVSTTQYLNEDAVTSAAIGSLQDDVDNPSNWTTGLDYTFVDGNKLAAMTFDQESISDGSGDGQLSKSEAVHALYAYYELNGLPSDNSPITVSVNGAEGNGTMTIVIRRKD